MAEKDKMEKSLEDYRDVFADIVNVLLFEGRDVVHEEDLQEGSPYSNYTVSGKVRDQERDVVKYWNSNQIRLATIGFENQTECDKDIPLRIISYDGASYRMQLSPPNSSLRYPVISLVLYYGYKHHWTGPRTLRQCLQVSIELDRYVGDYPINLFEIAYLSDEQVKLFKSDFRLVADYFVQMRKTGTYIPPSDEIIHVQEMLRLMSALTSDNRFIDSYEEIKQEKRVNMCEVLDIVEARGEEALASLNAWLYENGRDDDVKRGTLDKEYRKQLFKEYKEAHKA